MDQGRKSGELTAVLDKLYPAARDMVEVGRDVEGLESHPGWVVVAEMLTHLRDQHMQGLLRGTKPLEQAEYSQRLGFLNGISTALDAVATALDCALTARTKLDESARQAAGVG
jgi:hypothetical protein